MFDRFKDRYLYILYILNLRRGNILFVYVFMYIFIVMVEKVKKIFEVNVIFVYVYENIKFILFVWLNNCEWKMNFKVKFLRNLYIFKKK